MGRAFENALPAVIIFIIMIYREHKTIEFRCMKNLKKVDLVHSVSPHQLGILCTIPPNTLLFEDTSSSPRTIYKLDCSGFPLISGPTPLIRTELNYISDISFTEHDDAQLLFIAAGKKGLFAYNCCTGKLEWALERYTSVGITNDERGHLFHCFQPVGDEARNNAVEMFTAKGAHLGYLEIEKDEFFSPSRISWCRETSSLILAHKRIGERFISVFAVKYPE